MKSKAHRFWRDSRALLMGLVLGSSGMLAPAEESAKSAVEWKKLADGGQAEAQYQYAQCLITGRDVPEDYAEAAHLLQKAAEQGYPPAENELARCYRIGRGVPKDIVVGLGWLQKAADHNILDAQVTLAMAYATGDGTPKDEPLAAQWYECAAKAGSKFADGALSGQALWGRPKDAATAATMYKREGETGNVPAQTGYAACLEEGRGVKQNRAVAAVWYRKSAQQGDLVAKYRLGLLLQDSPESVVEAYEWLSISALEGVHSAQQVADALKTKIAPAKLTEADAHVRTRAKPVEPPPPANNLPAKDLPPGAMNFFDKSLMGTGTGFFTTENGFLATNFHVVKEGKRFELQQGDKKYPAKLIVTDEEHDLAILKVEGQFSALEIAPSDDVELGEPVRTVGFPRPIVMGVSPRTTSGEVNGLMGLHDNPSEFQVSVGLQPGNSGGALVTKSGKVIGVVSSGLNGRLTLLLDDGPPPENVNFAVKSNYLLTLLKKAPDAEKNLYKAGAPLNDGPALIKQMKSAAGLIWVYEK